MRPPRRVPVETVTSVCISTNVFLLIFSLAILSGGFAHAQTAPESKSAATTTSSPSPQGALAAEATQEAEGNQSEESETEAFRHSGAVQALARTFIFPSKPLPNHGVS